ncbi:MAG: hypothetical protein M5U28_19800 [Sandaracinaceae bacterium]|nr:hypothetical protein [Sandaracinaceae bacterium]
MAIGVLATLPALGVGFVHDDLLHRLVLEDRVAEYERGPHELYDFTGADPAATAEMIEAGYFPWFTDPALRIRFFRPLSSLLLALDSALFGRASLPAHLHSLLWFVLIALVAAAIFRRTLSPRGATLATLVYALAGAHADTTAWLAARHTLVGAAFGAVAVWAHIARRSEGSERIEAGAIIAPLALLAGMLASETALGAVVFIALFELLVSRGPLRARALAALPTLTLGLAHLVFYVLAGYGTKNSAAYISPFDDPLAFVGAVFARGALLVAELYGALPSLISSIAEPLGLPGAVYGALAAAGCALLVYRGRDRLAEGEDRRLLWLGASSVVCLAPMVGGVLGGRLLPLALVGSSAVVGTAIALAFELASKSPLARRLAFAASGLALVLLHFVLAPLLRVGVPFHGQHRRGGAGARRARRRERLRGGQHRLRPHRRRPGRHALRCARAALLPTPEGRAPASPARALDGAARARAERDRARSLRAARARWSPRGQPLRDDLSCDPHVARPSRGGRRAHRHRARGGSWLSHARRVRGGGCPRLRVLLELA